MRASHPGGRFTVESEIDRIETGISEDLQRPVGGDIPWYLWAPDLTQVDDTYAVSQGVSGGRMWHEPHIDMHYIVAQVFQGGTYQNDRGFVNFDTLRLTINMKDILRDFPFLFDDLDSHLKDRVVYRGKVFRPSRMYLRGQVLDTYTVCTLDLVEVSSAELVNDPQFQQYAEAGTPKTVGPTFSGSSYTTGGVAQYSFSVGLPATETVSWNVFSRPANGTWAIVDTVAPGAGTTIGSLWSGPVEVGFGPGLLPAYTHLMEFPNGATWTVL